MPLFVCAAQNLMRGDTACNFCLHRLFMSGVVDRPCSTLMCVVTVAQRTPQGWAHAGCVIPHRSSQGTLGVARSDADVFYVSRGVTFVTFDASSVSPASGFYSGTKIKNVFF